jgi:hypothetical protein
MKTPLLIILLAALVLPQQMHAQTAPTNDSSVTRDNKLYWATGGLGLVGPGFGVSFKGTYAWGFSSISAKVQGGSKTNLFGGDVNEVYGAGISYGWQSVNPNTLFRIAAGPAYYKQTRGTTAFFGFGTDSLSSIYRFGGELEIEAMGKFSSVGFSFIASLLAARDILYPSFTFNLSFGKLIYNED